MADYTPEKARDRYGYHSYRLRTDEISLQQAVELAIYLVSVVNGIYRFSYIDPLCGGEIDVAAIDESGFKWHRRKAVHSE